MVFTTHPILLFSGVAIAIVGFLLWRIAGAGISKVRPSTRP